MKKLFIKQKVLSLGGQFTIKDETGQDQYYVEGSLLSIPKTFTLFDHQRQQVGLITKKFFSFLPKFLVAIDNEEVVVIEQEFAWFKPRYRIVAKDLTIQGDWWAKNYAIFHHGKQVSTISKKWFTWGDFYEVTIVDETLERLIVSLVIAIDFAIQEANNGAATSSN